MGQIPLYRAAQPGVKIRLRLPAQFSVNFRRVNGITPIVTRPVCDESDQTFRLAQSGQHRLHHLQVGALIVPADVIHFSRRATAQNQVNGGAVILHIQPVPHILAGAVHRQALICQRPGDH